MPELVTAVLDGGIGFDAQSLGTTLQRSKVIALALLREGRVIFANPAFLSLFHAAGSLIGSEVQDLIAERDRDGLGAALETAAQGETTFTAMGLRADAPPFDLEVSLEAGSVTDVPTLVMFAVDITDRQRHEEKLAYLAYSDPLTGLANRALFADRLRQALLSARLYERTFAVLMADLDAFKAVNDTLGHDAGDVVLQLVAQRLRTCVRDSDTLVRLGGDEFAIVLPLLESREIAGLVARRMLDVMQPKLNVGEHEVAIGISIGIAVYPEHASAIGPLLTAADTALYEAKRVGKNNFKWASGVFDAAVVPISPEVWSVTHSVGIKEIDEQHAHLAKLIEDLSAVLKDGTDKAEILAGIECLISYTKFHFETEERLMEEHHLDGLVRHREAHRRLLDDIESLPVKGGVVSISLVLRYLQEWFLRHVDGPDKFLGRQLVAQGYH